MTDVILKTLNPKAYGCRIVTARLQGTSRPRVFLLFGHGDVFRVHELVGVFSGMPAIELVTDESFSSRATAYEYIEDLVLEESEVGDV